MSTPEDAWQILTSDAETDARSYYVTLPTDPNHPTRHSDESMKYCVGEFCSTDESAAMLQEFKIWKSCFGDDGSRLTSWTDETGEEHVCLGTDKRYEQPEFSGDLPEIGDEYPTLFDYWKSEVYVIQPVLTGLDADYVLVNLAAEKLSEENILDLYTLRQKGGDETKAFWFMKIADLRILDYYDQELTGYTDKFWNETFLGKLIPFTPILYVDPDNPERQSETFKPGYTPIYVKDIKFPPDGQGPFQLVYLPLSFQRDDVGPLTGPLIYKINKEYNPNQ